MFLNKLPLENEMELALFNSYPLNNNSYITFLVKIKSQN